MRISQYILNTSANSKFFSRVINLIFSVRFHSSREIGIRVWDLGLNKLEKYFLKHLNVEVVGIPKFVSFYAECYTWKPYVIEHAPENIFLHLDAGNSVFCDLNEVFEIISTDGIFFVDQGQKISAICPSDYLSEFSIEKYSDADVIAAGNIGFFRDREDVKCAISLAYEKAKDGYCLGYSESEIRRANGVSYPRRDCATFRHDQTVINCSLRATLGDYKIRSHSIWAALIYSGDVKILNQRKRSYKFFKKNISPINLIIFLYCAINDIYFIFFEWNLRAFNRLRRI